MGLTKLAKKCMDCEYKDICNAKSFETLDFIDGGAITLTPLMFAGNNYSDIEVNPTVMVDMGKMHKQTREQLRREIACVISTEVR